MILGVILVIIGLFFSDSVAVLFKIFPAGILGVILCFAGFELASVAKGIGWERRTPMLCSQQQGFRYGISALDF